jgi:post-segregation antitoxin (ccd killing protein)
MLKSCGARGVDVASLTITVDEEKVTRARALWAGASRLLTEGMRYGHLVEGMDIENPFL